MRSVNTATRDESPLAKLPGELRDEIYDHVLDFTRVFIAHALGTKRERWSVCFDGGSGILPCKPRNALALVRTCRQMRLEAFPTFFAANRWIIELSIHDGLSEWLDMLGSGALRSCRDVLICVDESTWMYGDYREIATTIANRYRKVLNRCGPTAKLNFVVRGFRMPALPSGMQDRNEDELEGRWDEVDFEVEGATMLNATAARHELESFTTAGELRLRQFERDALDRDQDIHGYWEEDIHQCREDWTAFKRFLDALMQSLEIDEGYYVSGP